MGVEVDLIVETENEALAVEIKSASKMHARMFKPLYKFNALTARSFKKYVVYLGDHVQRFDDLGDALPYRVFLEEVIPSLSVSQNCPV